MTTELDPQPYAFRHRDGSETRVRVYVHGQENYGWIFNPRAGYSQNRDDYS